MIVLNKVSVVSYRSTLSVNLLLWLSPLISLLTPLAARPTFTLTLLFLSLHHDHVHLCLSNQGFNSVLHRKNKGEEFCLRRVPCDRVVQDIPVVTHHSLPHYCNYFGSSLTSWCHVVMAYKYTYLVGANRAGFKRISQAMRELGWT